MTLPDAFLSRMQRMLGEEYPVFLEAVAQPPRRGLRVNPLRCGAPRFAELAPFPLRPVPFSPMGFEIGAEPTGKHPWHHAGVFYLQEPSAMAPVTAAGIRPGMRVLDLCAAPGGKSTQAAGELGGLGLLVSNEIVPSRAKILLSNLERCGVRNAAVLCETPERLCGRLPGFFDVVLADAPCSGEGLFRREPEAAGQWRPTLPEENARRQTAILNSASGAVASGGVLVYSTCTFAPEEDEGAADAFLKTHPDFEMEPIPVPFGRPANPGWAGAGPELALARRIFPQDGGEGHFVARFRRVSGADFSVPKPFEQSPLPKDKQKIFEDFWNSQFTDAVYGRPVLAGKTVYLLPEGLPDLKSLNLLRAGVMAGSFKGGRFEPAHALYLAADRSKLRNGIDLPIASEEITAFLHGEEIQAAPGTEKGYAAVLAQGFVTGFGKVSGGMLKNHYPKGLRNL